MEAQPPVSMGTGECVGCGGTLLVYGAELLALVPDELRPQLRESFLTSQPAGQLVAVASDDGWFSCPSCGTRGRYTRLSSN
jgi:hypothetical protein